MNTQTKIEIPDDELALLYAGNTYYVNKDIRNDVSYPHPPSWYVQRSSDRKTSKRYYSRPEGAIAALLTGRIVWES